MKIEGNIPSSFRDPSGFLFYKDGSIYRQVNTVYKNNYDLLMNSGLYEMLINAELLIPHEEANTAYRKTDNAYKIIKPELIPFISYPYEWCFSQLRDAALTTLRIQKIALDFGLSLKDCSAYNIQFNKGKPIFIDTLSFEKYHEGKPWVAYRQFCQHFLAPLALMSYRDIRLNQLLRIYIDGIPLDLASSLLPLKTRFNFSLFSHIHLHSKSQNYFANKTVTTKDHKIKYKSFLGLVDNLESVVKKLKWNAQGSEWADYYEDTNYTTDAHKNKLQIVSDFLANINPRKVWDLGSNIGLFSKLSSTKKIQTISFDIDPAAVERNYIDCIKHGETYILPLVLDITNPSPGLGWNNDERMSLLDRGPVDAVLALALIHHLAISNNVPLYIIADFFYRICKLLIIEFVPKNDSQVQRLLSTREDIFHDYSQSTFENAFNKYFAIEDIVNIMDSKRTIYLMRKR